jgi:hypothetical protein
VKTPFLGIVDYKNDNNEYDAYFELFLNDSGYVNNGKVFIKNNILYGRFQKLESNTFKLFDLSLNVGHVDTLTIEYTSRKGESVVQKYPVKYEDIITNYESKEVRKIVIENYFGYQFDFPVGEVFRADLVAFVTSENGVIGSYLRNKRDGKYIYLVPRGDILESVYDYSLMEFRMIK